MHVSTRIHANTQTQTDGQTNKTNRYTHNYKQTNIHEKKKESDRFFLITSANHQQDELGPKEMRTS